MIRDDVVVAGVVVVIVSHDVVAGFGFGPDVVSCCGCCSWWYTQIHHHPHTTGRTITRW